MAEYVFISQHMIFPGGSVAPGCSNMVHW